MLAAPDGVNLVLLSDWCCGYNTVPAAFTVDDAGWPGPVSGVTTGGTYRPTNVVGGDTGGIATVPLNGEAQKEFTMFGAGAGSRAVTATYHGTANFLASESETFTHHVWPVLFVLSAGPYTVAEGASLALEAASNYGNADSEWDLNGDGDFSDASGVAPEVSWAELVALGIDDGPASHTITARASVDWQTATDTAVLEVTDTPLSASVTGYEDAVAGEPLTIKVSAIDPSPVDMEGPFTYTVDWGDGSPVETEVGPADPPMTHVYTEPGTYTGWATAAAGVGQDMTETGRPFEFTVVVAAAELDDDDGLDGDLADTGFESMPLLAAGGMLVLCGTALLLMTRTRRPNLG